MLYETFTGTLPFKSDSDDLVAVIFGHVNEPPPPPRTVNRAVPAEIEHVILKLIEKEPDRRYQSAQEVVGELRALLGETRRRAGRSRAAATAVGDRRRALEGRQDRQRGARAAQHDRSGRARDPGAHVRQIEVHAQRRAVGVAGRACSRRASATIPKRCARIAPRSRRSPSRRTIWSTRRRRSSTRRWSCRRSPKPTGSGARIDRRELADAVSEITDAIPVFRGRAMLKEVEEGERLLYALQRTLIRIR